jgi:hypothetical protein
LAHTEWGEQDGKETVDFFISRSLKTEDSPIRFDPPTDKVKVGADTAVLHFTEVEVKEPNLLVPENRRKVNLNRRRRVKKVPGVLSGERITVTDL